MKLVFFGSSEFSIYVLDELKLHDILPALIVTTPDKPQGRKLVLTPNVVKVWAKQNNIPVIDPASLRNNPDLRFKLLDSSFDLFLVASYGKIIPLEIFEIPTRHTLNIHPSLLPKYRGASPIQSQILNGEKEIGVTIMQIEETMDTGPIVIQKQIAFLEPQAPERLASLTEASTRNFSAEKYPCSPELAAKETWPINRIELEKLLAIEGARLFAHILPEWLAGSIDPIMQDETQATYCQKIKKEDGLLNLENDPYENLRKIKAFEEWPGTYFFKEDKRVIIKDATIKDGKLQILSVIPEGKREMSYEDFLRGQK